MNDPNKAQLLRHIAKSDLTATEKRYLEELVEASDWIECSERMPAPETEVLVYGFNSEGQEVHEIDWLGRATRDWQYWNGILTVTHWMPIPKKPGGADHVD